MQSRHSDPITGIMEKLECLYSGICLEAFGHSFGTLPCFNESVCVCVCVIGFHLEPVSIWLGAPADVSVSGSGALKRSFQRARTRVLWKAVISPEESDRPQH